MGEGKARVFFALWPESGLRYTLVRVRDGLHARLAGRAMRDDTLHLTLLFIGDIDESRLPDLSAMAAGLRVVDFDLTLDQVVCWRHNRVGLLAASRIPDALRTLVSALEQGLSDLEIPFDRRPYRPHVTLIRNADCKSGNPALEPISWAARDFVLVRSTLRADGARYEELGRWPLLG
jgi:2'-5' RNA ligase